jgi:hypothetical protein
MLTAVSPGVAAPLTRLALMPNPTHRAAVTAGPVIQRYADLTVGAQRYRVSDDGSMALGRYAKHFYAVPGKAMEANGALQSSGSVIRLYERPDDTLAVGRSDAMGDLVKVEIVKINPESPEDYEQGEFIEMPNDCRETCELVTGDDRLYAETRVNPQGKGFLYPDPEYMKGKIIFDWLVDDELPRLRSERAALEGSSGWFGSVNRKKKELDERIDQVATSTAAATTLHDELAVLIDTLKPLAERKKRGETLDEADVNRMIELTRQLNETATTYARTTSSYYFNLDPRTRTAVDEELGIGRFAAPEVGEAFVTPFGEGEAAPYHYGAVIMVSADGMDRLTFENYINPAAPAENTMWNLDMYGAETNTWDERWNADGTSTTMQVG